MSESVRKEGSSRKHEGVGDKALHTVASAQSGRHSEPKAESESPTQPTEGGSNPQPSPITRKLIETLNKESKIYEVTCFNCNGWGHSKDGNICSHCEGIGKVEAVEE